MYTCLFIVFMGAFIQSMEAQDVNPNFFPTIDGYSNQYPYPDPESIYANSRRQYDAVLEQQKSYEKAILQQIEAQNNALKQAIEAQKNSYNSVISSSTGGDSNSFVPVAASGVAGSFSGDINRFVHGAPGGFGGASGAQVGLGNRFGVGQNGIGASQSSVAVGSTVSSATNGCVIANAVGTNSQSIAIKTAQGKDGKSHRVEVRTGSFNGKTHQTIILDNKKVTKEKVLEYFDC